MSAWGVHCLGGWVLVPGGREMWRGTEAEARAKAAQCDRLAGPWGYEARQLPQEGRAA